MKERWDGQPSAMCFLFSSNACGGWSSKISQPLSVQISKESGYDFNSPGGKELRLMGKKEKISHLKHPNIQKLPSSWESVQTHVDQDFSI